MCKFNFLLEIIGLETSCQTPDDFIQTALRLKPQLQITLNFSELNFHIWRTHVLNSKLQVCIGLKLWRIKYFKESGNQLPVLKKFFYGNISYNI